MRDREIIEFWEDVTTHTTEPSDTPAAEALATELVRRCEDMAGAEQLSKTDLETEIGGDLLGFFDASFCRQKLNATGVQGGEP